VRVPAAWKEQSEKGVSLSNGLARPVWRISHFTACFDPDFGDLGNFPTEKFPANQKAP
jgi:hypothetical protein